MLKKVHSERKQWVRSKDETAKKKSELELKVFHFAMPKMHLPSHLQDSIRRMGSPDNFTTDISELLHVKNVKEAYRASNRVSYIQQILWHNDRSTGLAYMKQTLVYLAAKGYYDNDTARVLNMQSKKGEIQGGEVVP
jgi:hypothetical protein